MKIKFIIQALIVSFMFLSSSCLIITPSEPVSDDTKSSDSQIMETNIEEEKEEIIETETVQTETSKDAATLDQIIVTNPQPDQLIESPLLIEGQARGIWYFEATFPVKLLDSDGNILVEYFAQAQGEWMTEDFVPFSSQIEFEDPSTDEGVLILEKDNPSGLSENDATLEIPVRFKNSILSD